MLLFGLSSCKESLESNKLIQDTASANKGFPKVERFTDTSKKSEVTCPLQTANTGVLLITGQSNSANHGNKKFTTQYPTKVLNYYKGKCYVASSPLLGATGLHGEWQTPLGDNLIVNGTYDTVIIISTGVSGSLVQRWKQGGKLNDHLLNVLDELIYDVTDVIWHQGESDFDYSPTARYMSDFKSFQESLSINAPIFMSVATKCGRPDFWTPNNDVANAQLNLIDDVSIFLGVNTDDLLLDEDRYDGCHFSESGMLKTAEEIAISIDEIK